MFCEKKVGEIMQMGQKEAIMVLCGRYKQMNRYTIHKEMHKHINIHIWYTTEVFPWKEVSQVQMCWKQPRRLSEALDSTSAKCVASQNHL